MDLPVPRYQPMLASSGVIRGEAGDYAYEVKLDGWRLLSYVVGGKLVVRTRNGSDVTAALPELEPLCDLFSGRSVVLDGELVAGSGRPEDFYRLSGRMGVRRPAAAAVAAVRTPVTFAAFDVLWCDGDVTGRPYTERRALLESFGFCGPNWCTVSSFPGDGPELFAACDQLGLEGLVAKRLDSVYRPGRQRTWVKAKVQHWKDAHAPYRHER